MAAGHPGLYVPGDSAVHRLPPEAKIVASVLFTITVVATPATVVAAFAGYALLLAAVLVATRIAPGRLFKRSLIEVPFVALAVLLPFVSAGPRVEWLGMSLSAVGILAGWNIVAKATLGVWASLLLAATTDVAALLAGLDRLRFPSVMTQIATFMVRYVHVLLAEAQRMRVARLSRGDNPRFLWQLRGFAAGIGVLFLRSYERGERVYVAMLARGYNGRIPLSGAHPRAGAAQWATAAMLPVSAAAIAATAILA